MSTGEAAAVTQPPGELRLVQRLTAWYRRLTPSQGWTTFVILLAVMWVTVDSVTAADWVATPGIMVALAGSAVTGLALSKVRANALLLHPIGIFLGILVVAMLAAPLAEAQGLLDQVREIWARLGTWYGEASSGGVTSDLLPISVVLIGLTWIMGYVGTWFIFRSNNPWVALILAGTAILSNLSFLPEEFAYRFFIFAFLAMLLVVRIDVVRSHALWRKARFAFNPISGWQTLHAALWFSLTVVLLAAFLPLRVVVSYELAGVWAAARTPISSLEDVFTRLTSGIPCRKNFGCEFGDSLPFTGRVSLGDEVIFQAKTDYPSYWLAHTYSEYRASGWITGKNIAFGFGPDTVPPPRSDLLKRVPINQALQTVVETSEFLAGGTVDRMSASVIGAALVPKRFEIDLRDSTDDRLLPQDLQELADRLRRNLAPPPDVYLEAFISRSLPSDLVLIEVSPRDAASVHVVETITVERKETTPDIVSWKLEDGLGADETYSMVSYVSVATDDDLRSAGTEYGGFITDHYLQLPPEFPQRVRNLAEALTQGTETPLDKALAVQSYLRGPDIEYTTDIDVPPVSADGVDYFLFESKAGYSAYFASAMAVMLRTVGVPTRMVAGYAPGEFDEAAGRTIVKDSDAHGWVQVYFPRYGWIDFEPTAKLPVPYRGLGPRPDADVETPVLADEDGLEDDESSLDPLELISGLEETGAAGGGETSRNPLGIVVPIAAVVVVLVGAWVALGILWRSGASGEAMIARSYFKLSLLGRLAGVRPTGHRTPIEYAEAIGEVVPQAAPGSRRIAWAYAAYRYGGHRVPADEGIKELGQAWKSVRGSLLSRALARLVGQ